MAQDLINIQRTLQESKILTCFSGKFSQGLIEEMGEAVKKHMESEEKPRNAIFNVFSIFIEQSQNIKNYVASKEGSDDSQQIEASCIVCIGKEAEGYFIHSGNMIDNRDIPDLQQKLDQVADKSKEELKQLYKAQIKKDYAPEKSGAGIGLIDIARKASQPVSYSFFEMGSHHSFYEIKVIV